MVHTARSSILNFDRGIARVLVQEAGPGHPLPHQRKLSPSESVGIRQVAGLIDAKNLSTAVAQAMVPGIRDRQVLRQEIFERAIAAAAKKLKALTERANDPATAEALENMIDVLEEQEGLQDSLAYFRSLLIAG